MSPSTIEFSDIRGCGSSFRASYVAETSIEQLQSIPLLIPAAVNFVSE